LRTALCVGKLPPQILNWLLLPQSCGPKMAHLVYPIATAGHCALRVDILLSGDAPVPSQLVQLTSHLCRTY
jgi:hypothetical protein